jgi:endonuclease YncB( thermonuclease family)
MMKNERLNLRVSEELLNYCRKNFENTSLFIREAMREKIESGLLTDPSLSFIEIRAKTPYNYFAKLEKVIDGDTLLLNVDCGFFIDHHTKVRLIGIDCPPIDTKKGREAAEFIEKELKKANILIETRKKEKYGRYLCYLYYHKEYSDFEDIIRHGKLLNEELVKAGLANRYDEEKDPKKKDRG